MADQQSTETTAAPNTAAEAYPATAAAPGTEPPTKSALKRMEKEAALAAKKALKKAAAVANPSAPKDGSAAPKKKEVKKPAVVAEEPAFIEVPEGLIKGKLTALAQSHRVSPR